MLIIKTDALCVIVNLDHILQSFHKHPQSRIVNFGESLDHFPFDFRSVSLQLSTAFLEEFIDLPISDFGNTVNEFTDSFTGGTNTLQQIRFNRRNTKILQLEGALFKHITISCSHLLQFVLYELDIFSFEIAAQNHFNK